MSIIDDDRQYQPINHRPTARISSSMNSSALPQRISNLSLIDQQTKTSNEDETSTYSFRHVTKKLQHAKSHGELYQPSVPLPLPPIINMSNDENEIKSRQKLASESPPAVSSTRLRSATTTVVPIVTRSMKNSTDETINSSSSHKIPLWKRFKKIIAPSKRNKELQNPYLKAPTTQLNELSTTETSK